MIEFIQDLPVWINVTLSLVGGLLFIACTFWGVEIYERRKHRNDTKPVNLQGHIVQRRK